MRSMGTTSPGAPEAHGAEAGAVATSGAAASWAFAVSTERSDAALSFLVDVSITGGSCSVLVPSEGYFADLPSAAAQLPYNSAAPACRDPEFVPS